MSSRTLLPGRAAVRGAVAPILVSLLAACASAPPPAPPPPPEPVVSEPAVFAEPEPAPEPPPAGPEPLPVVVPEAWETVRRPEEDLGAVAVWPGRGARPWLLATAEATGRLLVYDAGSGEPLRDFGGGGEAAGLFRRPEGIAVADDLAFVVERGNGRVQVLRLPGLSTVGFVGAGELAAPHGVAVAKPGSATYDLYVTDDHDNVHHYRVALAPDGLTADLLATFSDGEGDGPRVEAFGAQGVALYPCADGTGYRIAAEQGEDRTRFRVLDRRTGEEVGSFTGEITAHTEGVWMWPAPSAEFPQGALYAVHDDRSVTAFDWAEVTEALALETCR